MLGANAGPPERVQGTSKTATGSTVCLDDLLRLLTARLAPKRYFTIAEAVSYSGHSRSSLYEAHKRGDLIFTKFGGATRIERINLDAFLDATGEDIAA